MISLYDFVQIIQIFADSASGSQTSLNQGTFQHLSMIRIHFRSEAILIPIHRDYFFIFL